MQTASYNSGSKTMSLKDRTSLLTPYLDFSTYVQCQQRVNKLRIQGEYFQHQECLKCFKGLEKFHIYIHLYITALLIFETQQILM